MRSCIHSTDVPSLLLKLQHGDRTALSRLLSLAADGDECAALRDGLNRLPKSSSPVIALTGSGGVGKSSLLGVVVAHFAARGERIGVLACDPESPVTGGSLLGDRCRIAGNALSEQVFIRSLSTAAGQQGLARNIELMRDLMRAFGFDRVFIETVGAGQSDVAVHGIADIVVLVVQPLSGDDLQWEKAGVLEIADLVVVNKSDLLGADQTVADITQQLHYAKGTPPPVVKTSVARNEGIDDLCRKLDTVQELNTPAAPGSAGGSHRWKP